MSDFIEEEIFKPGFKKIEAERAQIFDRKIILDKNSKKGDKELKRAKRKYIYREHHILDRVKKYIDREKKLS